MVVELREFEDLPWAVEVAPVARLLPTLVLCKFLLRYLETLLVLVADCLRLPSMALQLPRPEYNLDPPMLLDWPLLPALLYKTGLEVTNFVDKLLLELLS